MQQQLLTAHQLAMLPVMGRELERYWRESLPKMYAEMYRKGTLLETLDRQGDELNEQVADLMQRGLDEDQAKEIVREIIHGLPPER